ncbi:SH3 domain-containing protein [Pyxidicoccus sp. 3LG]
MHAGTKGMQQRLFVASAAIALALGTGCGAGLDGAQEADVTEPPFENEALIGGPPHDHEHEHAESPPEVTASITGSLPVGTALVTTDALNLRSGPGTGYGILLTMPVGVRVTLAQSAPQNFFYRVTYGSTTGWAHGDWLARASSSVYVSGGPVLSHVQSFANALCASTGACKPSTYSGHHPTANRALDILASSAYGSYPSDNYALGDRAANFAFANWGTYRIWYVIWRQRINYNDGLGWQWMADRGSITQNHYDHVHVSFYP